MTLNLCENSKNHDMVEAQPWSKDNINYNENNDLEIFVFNLET